jgi:hypothetical protein
LLPELFIRIQQDKSCAQASVTHMKHTYMYGYIDYIGTQASTKNPQTPTREEKKIPGDKYKTLI